MSWATGLSIFCGLLFLIWVIAELTGRSSSYRRIEKLNAAREDWRAKVIESQMYWRTDGK